MPDPTDREYVIEYMRTYNERGGFIDFARTLLGPGTMAHATGYSDLYRRKTSLQNRGVNLPEFRTKTVDAEAVELNELIDKLLRQ